MLHEGRARARARARALSTRDIFDRPKKNATTTTWGDHHYTTPQWGSNYKFKKWRARARLFSRLRNFAGGLAKVTLSEAIRSRFC